MPAKSLNPKRNHQETLSSTCTAAMSEVGPAGAFFSPHASSNSRCGQFEEGSLLCNSRHVQKSFQRNCLGSRVTVLVIGEGGRVIGRGPM